MTSHPVPHPRKVRYDRAAFGEMAERLNVPPWKGGMGATSSGVRIPLSPPSRASTRPVAKTSIGLDKKLVSKNSTYLGRIF